MKLLILPTLLLLLSGLSYANPQYIIIAEGSSLFISKRVCKDLLPEISNLEEFKNTDIECLPLKSDKGYAIASLDSKEDKDAKPKKKIFFYKLFPAQIMKEVTRTMSYPGTNAKVQDGKVLLFFTNFTKEQTVFFASPYDDEKSEPIERYKTHQKIYLNYLNSIEDKYNSIHTVSMYLDGREQVFYLGLYEADFNN